MSTIAGLSSAQVQERRARGETNHVTQSTSRSYRTIIQENVFSAVNIVLYAIGAGLALAGDLKSALATVMLVLFNAVVGIFQETRAKQQLDQIALLARSKVVVRRDGQDADVDPSELVLGDVIVIRPGDQIPVDGVAIEAAGAQVDESALTGESDLIAKAAGEDVLSGTYLVAGSMLVEATQVGEKSFASSLTRDARKYTAQITPLQRSVNRLLRVLLAIVIFFAILAVLALFVLDLSVQTWLQIMAVITGSVSAGLLTLITLNYSGSALRIGRKGGLVQQINAVESLSNVTVLCTDKTGTLTTNAIEYHDVYAVGVEKATLERMLAVFAASASSTNKTSEAILNGLPGVRQVAVDEVAFSSARKWSALAFDNPADVSVVGGEPLKGVYVLGALEMLEPYFSVPEAARRQVEEWSDRGLRVLVFAYNPDETSLHAGEEPVLPALTLAGVLSLSDTLRPHLEETIAAFTRQGVEVKIISGDNPETVAALARQANFPGELKTVSGPQLAAMSRAEFAQAAVEASVFGRISPQQKEALVDALRARGEYVAMIGDGVNDVLSLKKANVGIAMESATTATRSVAAMLLLGDSFEVLPLAFTEGQRTVNSIQEILKMFMTTVFALLLLIIGVGLLGIGFPFTTLQSTLMSFFTRGAPPLVLALTATAGLSRRNLLKDILEFTLPAAFLIFLFGLMIYIAMYFAVDNRLIDATLSQADVILIGQHIGKDYSALDPAQLHRVASVAVAQTALTTFFVWVGVLLILFLRPPVRWLAGAAEYRGVKWIPLATAVALVIGYAVIAAVPGLRIFFDLTPLTPTIHAGILLAALAWGAVQLGAWRGRVLQRFLDLDENGEAERGVA